MDEPTTRLARLDSCAVSDALDKLGLKVWRPAPSASPPTSGYLAAW
jgi:hypothetical protein